MHINSCRKNVILVGIIDFLPMSTFNGSSFSLPAFLKWNNSAKRLEKGCRINLFLSALKMTMRSHVYFTWGKHKEHRVVSHVSATLYAIAKACCAKFIDNSWLTRLFIPNEKRLYVFLSHTFRNPIVSSAFTPIMVV